jgi:hypothetical protein
MRPALASGPMGSSGLIYAAIVAAWAAVLVPRWVRRNEEIDQAREADLARGVRVLGQAESLTRSARMQARHAALPVEPAEQAAAMAGPGVEPPSEYGQAARRRRRVLSVLVLAFAAVSVAAVVGKLPLWSVAVPSLLLGGFLWAGRRAAAVEAASRAQRRGRMPTVLATSTSPQTATSDQPEPAVRTDPQLWEPVPVPLPTYLTKPMAPQLATRTIDLSVPGAWTSGRIESAQSTPPPTPMPAPQPVEDDVEELPEHRPAVGD